MTCLVFVRRFPRRSRSIHFGNVSEANGRETSSLGPRDPKRFGRGKCDLPTYRCDLPTPGPFPTPPMYLNGKARWGRDDCLAFTKSGLKWHSKINTCCYTGYTTLKDLHTTLTNLQVDEILIDSYTVGRFLGNCLPTPPLTQY